MNRLADPEPSTAHLGPLWEIWIEGGSEEDVGAGHPLNSSLAEVLGYRVGFEDWSEWVNALARRIGEDFGEPHGLSKH